MESKDSIDDHEIRARKSCTTMNGGGGDGCVLVEINPSVHDQSAEAVGTPIIDESDGFLDLEREFWEEMDEVDSIDESDRYGDDEKMEVNCDELEDELMINQSDDSLPPESGAPPGWSQFLISAEGVSRYMEEVAAQVSDVSIMIAASPPSCLNYRNSDAKNDGGVQLTPVQRNKTDKSDERGVSLLSTSTDDSTAFNLPIFSECFTVDGAIHGKVAPLCSPILACDEPSENRPSVALDGINPCSGKVALAIKQDIPSDKTLGGLIAKGVGGRENDSKPILNSSQCLVVSQEAIVSQLISPSTTALRPEDPNGDVSDQSSFAASSPCKRGAQILPVKNDRPSLSARNHHCSSVDLPSEVAPLSVDSSAFAKTRTSLVTTISDVPWRLQSFEVPAMSAREHENEIQKQKQEICGTADGGVDFGMNACIAHSNVVASVTEEEVLMRIEREKGRAVKARQKKWSHELRRARLTKSAEKIQAVWRGRRARATVSPALAARRQELDEIRAMLQEEERCACIAATKAKKKKAEHMRQKKELNAMRCEEKRTRLSWISLARREETVRQEELARMRAEERRDRALLDLKREDSRRADMVRRQAGESSEMHREDLAARKLARQEKTRSAELSTMAIEDKLSIKRAKIERHELTKAREEGKIMAAEETISSIWNSQYRKEREAVLRRARALSTPLQRAMDPKRLTAARQLLSWCPRSKMPIDSEGTSSTPTEETAACDEFGRSKHLIVERYGRRVKYRDQLLELIRKVVQVRRTKSTTFNCAIGLTKRSDIPFEWRGGYTERNGQVCSKRERETVPLDRGIEDACSLAPDMISHLGPLPDITGLELCVEGLTSASWLQACTSLKSLSLNVNRLSSPADLVANTALVRLELRDNRLSSLRGLSGLPNLRELRLDMNHLTSLHELTDLPALVELSANTNHIRELPEGFATGLLSSTTPNCYPIEYETVSEANVTPQPSCVTFEAMGQGGLQRLELYHNRITSVHHRALEGCGSLTHLNLGRNQLETLDGRGLECCPSLSTLVLSQNLLREPPAPLRLPLLTELWLSGNRISSMGDWARSPPSPSPLSSMASSLNTSGNTTSEPILVSRFSSGNGRVAQEGAITELVGTREVINTGGVKIGGRGWTHTPDNREGMWLPSLEVIHLQDNILENMGGFWSLAGSPLLRFLDASFNRLRTPGDFVSCLRSCGELEEVRFHDNPVAGRKDYADAAALGCPKLAKLDGNILDLQAHWQAGCNTYKGRSDLVLPFLLQATASATSKSEYYRNPTPTEVVQAPNNNLVVASSVVENTTNTPLPLSSSMVAPRCPWCAAGATTSDGNAGTMIDDDTGAKQSAEDCTAAKGVPLSNHAVKRTYGNKVPLIACECCGCRFPDTFHWSGAPFPQNVGFPPKWEDLISAGHRWRRNTNHCTLGAENEALDQEYEELVAADMTFRRACLRHRKDRSAMRHRHRREERDLESTKGTERKGAASVSSRITGTTVGESSADSQLSSIPRSRELLEIELELKDKHARERAQLVAEQLSLHFGIEGDRRNLDEDAVWKVVRSCSQIGETMVGQNPEVEEKNGEGMKSTRDFPAHCHRTEAATRIQHSWCQWRVTRNIHPVESQHRVKIVTIGGQRNKAAATMLQATFRGFHVRQSLKAALNFAEYVDEELEGLLRENGGARFDLDRFLTPPPELAQEWWESAAKPPSRSMTPENVTRELISLGHIQPHADSKMLAADPVVGRTTPFTAKQNDKSGRGMDLNLDKIIGGIGQVGLTDTSRCATSRAGEDHGEGECAGGGEVREVNGCGRQPGEGMHDNRFLLRPETTTAIGALQISIGETTEVDVSDKVNGQSSGVHSGGENRGSLAGVRNELMSAWGLKDPRVARAMMRRMQRMRKFERGEVRRERLKDPGVRFNAFLKKTGHRVIHTGNIHKGIDSTRSETSDRGDTHRSTTRSEGGWSEGASSPASPILASIKSAWTGKVNDHAIPGLQLLASTQLPSLHDDNGTRASRKINSIRQEQQAAPPNGREGRQLGATISRPWPPPQPTKLHHHYPSRNGSPANATLARDMNFRGTRSRPRAPVCAHDLGHGLDVEAFSREHTGVFGGQVGRATCQAADGRRATEGGAEVGGTTRRGSKQRDVGRWARGSSCLGYGL